MRSIQMAVQIDSTHWLVIFVVSTAMERNDFIDLITTEIQVGL